MAELHTRPLQRRGSAAVLEGMARGSHICAAYEKIVLPTCLWNSVWVKLVWAKLAVLKETMGVLVDNRVYGSEGKISFRAEREAFAKAASFQSTYRYPIIVRSPFMV